MSCTFDANCFTVNTTPAGTSLDPRLNPSFENGLECLPDGLWDPDEKVQTFCQTIFNGVNSTVPPGATLFVPVLSNFVVTNPSPTMPALVWWSWWVTHSRLSNPPNARASIITESCESPVPGPLCALQDAGYHTYTNGYALQSELTIPGCSFAYPSCPVVLAPGASRAIRWRFRIEANASNVGLCRFTIGQLYASAMVVTIP